MALAKQISGATNTDLVTLRPAVLGDLFKHAIVAMRSLRAGPEGFRPTTSLDADSFLIDPLKEKKGVDLSQQVDKGVRR